MWAVFLLVTALAESVNYAEDKQRPVNRVINLLKEMQANLEKEAKEDQEVYDNLSCWCESNDSEKSKAVEIAQQRIQQLEATIEELTARSSELTTDIKKVKEELASDQQALAKATALREKESAAFNADEKDAIQAITSLKSAITVLKKHNSLSQESLVSIQHAMDKYRIHHRDSFMDLVTPSERRMLTGFLQQPTMQSYSNQSGEIFGVLEQMLENFQNNLSQSQKDEQAAIESFEALRSAKEDEIRAGQEQLDNKSEELAVTNEKNAQAKEDLEDTSNALSSDQKFLIDLKERCAAADKEFAERSKTRREEILAVGEAIEILTNDEAHETLGRSFDFLDLSAQRRQAAAQLLRTAGGAQRNPALLSMAVAVQLDAFTKVKKAIDDMIQALVQEKGDEIKHRDWCNDEFKENENQTTTAERKKGDFQGKIDDLTQTIKTLSENIATLKAEISEMHVQLKRASEDRQAENKEFQHTVVDQRATQKILQQALVRLQKFYSKKDEAFVQVRKADPEPGAAAPPPPQGFKEYKKNAGASGVVSMIQQVIEDSKLVEQEATKAEQDAQAAYEGFVKDSNEGVAQRGRDVVNKTEAKAQAEQDKSAADAGLKGTVNELEKLSSYNGELHKSCDFVLKNFDTRQTARDQEVEALRQAKAILSGADFQ